MDWDEREQRPKTNSPKFEEWSIEELKSYIQDLRSQIERAEALIREKRAHLDGAGQIFKKQSKT